MADSNKAVREGLFDFAKALAEVQHLDLMVDPRTVPNKVVKEDNPADKDDSKCS